MSPTQNQSMPYILRPSNTVLTGCGNCFINSVATKKFLYTDLFFDLIFVSNEQKVIEQYPIKQYEKSNPVLLTLIT